MFTQFLKPKDLASAVELLDRYKEKAVIVNGGTDIVIDIAQRKISPEVIVYVADVAELAGIREKDGWIELGGAATYAQMEVSPICHKAKGLMEALRSLGSPAIRAVATPAGNIGTAAPSADCTTMLMALEAEIVLARLGGDRTVALGEFFTGTYKTVVQPGEVIKAIRFKSPPEGEGTGYCRIARRKSQDIAKVLVGAALKVENGTCKRAVVSLGALNATCVCAPSLSKAFIGKTREQVVDIIKANHPAEAGLRESYFKHYKELVTKNVVKRAVEMAWDNALGV